MFKHSQYYSRKLFPGIFPYVLGMLLMVMILCPSMPVQADTHSAEYERQLKVKAAFIRNLVGFSQWQKTSGFRNKQVIEICLYQKNILFDGLDTLTGKKLKFRKVHSRVVKADRIGDTCDVILIPALSLQRFLNFNDAENLKNKITITDLTDGLVSFKTLENKIIFRLIRSNRQLRFEVNKTAAQRLNIVIGSELLKLGNIITEPDRIK